MLCKHQVAGSIPVSSTNIQGIQVNEKIKLKWVTALKSGEYIQAMGDLKLVEDGQTRHCCLGVLTDLYCRENGVDFETVVAKDPSDMSYQVSPKYKVLPPAVSRWAGLVYKDQYSLCESDPTLVAYDEEIDEDGYTCSQANDDKDLSFEDIARIIERKL